MLSGTLKVAKLKLKCDCFHDQVLLVPARMLLGTWMLVTDPSGLQACSAVQLPERKQHAHVCHKPLTAGTYLKCPNTKL